MLRWQLWLLPFVAACIIHYAHTDTYGSSCSRQLELQRTRALFWGQNLSTSHGAHSQAGTPWLLQHQPCMNLAAQLSRVHVLLHTASLLAAAVTVAAGAAGH